MDPARWKQIDELVDAALELPEDERPSFVENAAIGDPDLKRAVLQLLDAQGATNEFLQSSGSRAA